MFINSSSEGIFSPKGWNNNAQAAGSRLIINPTSDGIISLKGWNNKAQGKARSDAALGHGHNHGGANPGPRHYDTPPSSAGSARSLCASGCSRVTQDVLANLGQPRALGRKPFGLSNRKRVA